MPTMNISLTEELSQMVHSKVSSGLYSNASEVVREALRTMLEDKSNYEIKLKNLKKELNKGLNDSKNKRTVKFNSIDELKDFIG